MGRGAKYYRRANEDLSGRGELFDMMDRPQPKAKRMRAAVVDEGDGSEVCGGAVVVDEGADSDICNDHQCEMCHRHQGRCR